MNMLFHYREKKRRRRNESLGGKAQEIMALFLAVPTKGDLVKVYRNSLCSLLCCKENTA